MQRFVVEVAVTVSDLKKSPTAFIDGENGAPVAILNHNRVLAYLVPAKTFEAMMQRLDSQAVVEIGEARADD